MKVLTILGTRPEIIRLSRVIPLLDEVLGRESHTLVNTGQNYDDLLSTVFFKELGIRDRDYYLNASGSFAQQMATIFSALEHTLAQERPDRVLILGDTNSSLAAIVAARLRIPVYHMEAGNRCYDDRTPEEVNRRLIDHVSSVLLPYTERARQNLLAEGIHSSRIFVTGNPIHEVIEHYGRQIDLAAALARERLGIKSQGYFLVTLHREENVGDRERLKSFLAAFAALNNDYSFPVIVSTHPRTRKRLEDLRHIRNLCGDTRFLDPFGFFDFIALQRSAFCVLSDSGTVQEESCLLGVPSVTLRDTTERPETVEAGASVLSSADPVRIVALVNQVTSVPDGRTKKWTPSWTVPAEYLRLNVAETVVRILTSHCQEATR